MTREPGFYWVRYRGNWMVAEWACDVWFFAGRDDDADESELEEVGQRIEPPKFTDRSQR